MRHAGLPTDVNWCNQDPVAIGKIAQVVSLKLFHFINYSLLHIAKAISRNKHLKCYKGNWATIKIMKTLLKNWCSCQTHIGLSDIQELSLKDIRSEDKREDDEWEEMYMNNNREKREENGSGVNGDGEEEEEEEEEFEGKDNGDGEEEEEEAFEVKERKGQGSSDAVTNSFSSLTHVCHAFFFSFSFTIGRHLPQGKHAFHICLPHFYPMFYMCSPQG